MASQPGTEDDEGRSARWHSETGAPPPQRVVVADDRTTADGAYRPLRRASDVREACAEVHCPASEPLVISLRELLGIISVHEWRKKCVEIPALGA